MKWHETHRARMAAKTLAKHRKRVAREKVLDTTILIARQMNDPDLIGRVEAVRAGK